MTALESPDSWKTPHREERVEGTHVLFWDLDAVVVATGSSGGIPTRTEVAGVDRFRSGSPGFRRFLSRALLRATLAAWTDRPPGGLVFTYGPHGKPHLEGGPAFNASHSGSYFVLAVRPSGQVGVDIEVVRPSSDLMAIARRCFTHEEAREIGADPDTLVDSFFRTWVRKEALVKAVGAGLSLPLQTFRVSSKPVPEGTNVLLESRLPARYGSGWTVVPIWSTPDAQAALAWNELPSNEAQCTVPDSTQAPVLESLGNCDP